MVENKANTTVNADAAAPAQPSVPPTTTSEQDLRTAGQRKLNMVWEMTQASIAIGVVAANIIYVFVQWFSKASDDRSKSLLLESAFFLVVGFYFGRTNHARIGDLGPRTPRGNERLDDRA